MTTEQIADQLSDEEDDFTQMSGFSDDSDVDGHWVPEEKDGGSSGSEVMEGNAQMDAGDDSDCSIPPVQDAPGVIAEREIRVFMLPPEETAIADTDCDSG